jgi:hypothetical protein
MMIGLLFGGVLIFFGNRVRSGRLGNSREKGI